MSLSPETQNPAGGRGSELKHATVKAQVERGHSMSSGSSLSTLPDPEILLSRLEKVRKAGAGWTARCPSHQDRSASLSVAMGDDGRILAHCFAGCSVHDVLGAIGLQVADLFPRRLADASPQERKRARELAALAGVRAAAGVLDHEATVVLIAAGDVGRGQTLGDADHARLALAAERIRAARVAIGGAR